MIVKDAYWVAGILEGEGCFLIRKDGHNPCIALGMTDEDIVVRAAKILGSHCVVLDRVLPSGKNFYYTRVYGNRAIQWMLTLFSIMGTRRQEKIKLCLEAWKNKSKNSYKQREGSPRKKRVVWSEEGGVPSQPT